MYDNPPKAPLWAYKPYPSRDQIGAEGRMKSRYGFAAEVDHAHAIGTH